MFSSPQAKSKAEKLRSYILQALESVLGSPVSIEIRCEAREKVRLVAPTHTPLVVLPTTEDGSSQISDNLVLQREYGNSEIVEVADSPKEQKFSDIVDIHGHGQPEKRGLRVRELNHCRSLVKGKVSLAHVIQHAEGSTQHNAWTRRKAVSIAEKLEQENL